MDIIIAGAGDVGMHLARWLSSESHDITLIDVDEHRLNNLDQTIDAITIVGEITEFRILQRAKVAEAELFISVTNLEEANILSAIYAKKLGAQKTIARISQMQYLNDAKTLNLRELGIDELISPESLAAREVRYLIKTNAASESIEFENGKITLLGLDVEEDVYVAHKTVQTIASQNKERNYVMVAVQRGTQSLIPRGDTEILPGDHIFVITHQEGKEEVLELFGKRRIEVNNIMIMGGSRTGMHLARKLSQDYRVKVIEENPDKAEEIAADFPDALVLNFDGTDVQKLEEEGLSNIDVFIAVTGNSETNVLSCLVARDRGAKKTIALVENIEYQTISHNIGIDSLINKKLAAANFIYRYIRQGDFIMLSTLQGVDAEVMEFHVTKKCRITQKAIKDLNLPKGVLIGGIVRQKEALIPTGDFQIELDDRVVVFAKTDEVKKVGRFFK